ncbi:MAG: hypothetical protein PHY55_03215 [Bacteroidales bacterium]|nr:hypothetical protein [Bacteroidales bacterium]
MKKIISVIIVCFFFNSLFSQGELTDDYSYFIFLNKEISDIIQSTISKDKLEYIKANEKSKSKAFIYISTCQDSNGYFKKIEIAQTFDKKIISNREIRKIKKKVKELGQLNIYIDKINEGGYILTKKYLFSNKKYVETLFVIRLDRDWDKLDKIHNLSKWEK